jgi:hypothetical protein
LAHRLPPPLRSNSATKNPPLKSSFELTRAHLWDHSYRPEPRRCHPGRAVASDHPSRTAADKTCAKFVMRVTGLDAKENTKIKSSAKARPTASTTPSFSAS